MTALESPTFDATSSQDGARTVVRFGGELDLACHDDARRQVAAALLQGSAEIVIDLRRLSFMDARGMHVLMYAARACERRDRRLLIVPGPPHVHRVIELCGLEDRFEFLREQQLAA